MEECEVRQLRGWQQRSGQSPQPLVSHPTLRASELERRPDALLSAIVGGRCCSLGSCPLSKHSNHYPMAGSSNSGDSLTRFSSVQKGLSIEGRVSHVEM